MIDVPDNMRRTVDWLVAEGFQPTHVMRNEFFPVIEIPCSGEMLVRTADLLMSRMRAIGLDPWDDSKQPIIHVEYRPDKYSGMITIMYFTDDDLVQVGL